MNRRGFIGALFAPAVLRIVKPMPLWVPEATPVEFLVIPNTMLTLNIITREAIRLFKNSNAFLKEIDRHYVNEFATPGFTVGQTIKIKLPN